MGSGLILLISDTIRQHLTPFLLLGKTVRQSRCAREPPFSAPLGDTMAVSTVALLTMGFVGKSPWGYAVPT